ncbi:cell surface protein [Acidovorax sp. M14]|uniref:cell surface protein n=1 Tax=Acidovorax sp. M14 TaxID=3411354 RepID=UPI003BF5AB47
MRKNVLALSIAAMIGGFAGVAQASVITPAAAGVVAKGDVFGTYAGTEAPATVLEVNPGNVGHMLVVPYFTAQNGNMTVLHLSNTDQNSGKAVKIRFRGAANSDDIMDFQIYLSPGDIWTGAVAQGAGGTATLYSADKTCTVPAIPAAGASFSTARLNAADNVNGTREGYVEIFNMADIPSNKNFDKDGKIADAGANSVVYTLTKHVNGVAPCSVEGSAARTALNDIALTNFTVKDAAVGANANAVGFGASTTGLAADWYILNLAQSTAFSGSATAIEARVAAGGAAGAANFVHFPQTSAGSATFFAGAGTAADSFTADPLLRQFYTLQDKTTVTTGPVVTPLFVDLPDMSTPYVTAIDAVGNAPKVQAINLTAALSRTSVSNQFALDAGIKAATDWVFSMPTRRYSVAANYKAAKTSDKDYRLYSDLSVINNAYTTTAASAPGAADEWFYPANTRVDARGNICVDATSMRFYDREETTSGAAPIFSPAVASQLSFCGETSVLSFSASKVLGSSSDLTATTMTTPYTNGWTVVTTTNAFATAAADNTNALAATAKGGLPILGDAFIKVNNDSAGNGFASTFGITWTHRFNR